MFSSSLGEDGASSSLEDTGVDSVVQESVGGISSVGTSTEVSETCSKGAEVDSECSTGAGEEEGVKES